MEYIAIGALSIMMIIMGGFLAVCYAKLHDMKHYMRASTEVATNADMRLSEMIVALETSLNNLWTSHVRHQQQPDENQSQIDTLVLSLRQHIEDDHVRPIRITYVDINQIQYSELRGTWRIEGSHVAFHTTTGFIFVSQNTFINPNCVHDLNETHNEYLESLRRPSGLVAELDGRTRNIELEPAV